MLNYQVHIYTDGASRGNPGKGGYGVVMEVPNSDYKKEFCEGFRLTTNNRMELLAVIAALEKLKKSNTKVLVVSDSKYVVDAINQKWIFAWEKKNFKGVKNPDLWIRFLKIFRRHNVDFKWIKGHSNHPQNERCDWLAVWASNQKKLSIDLFYEESKNELF